MVMPTEKKTSSYIWLPMLLSIILVFGILIGMRLQPAQPILISEVSQEATNTPTSGNNKIDQLLRFIESKYVDDVDREQLVDEAIGSILEQLDPHSSYISAEELTQVNEQMEGNFEGIGVEFMIFEDTVVVVTPLTGGPAETVGIMAGDRIVQVEDSVIAGIGITNAGIIGLLKGEKGTSVKIGILRIGSEEVKEYEITRDKIPIKSIDAAYMISESTGYIKINRFSATTDKEFLDALEALDREGLKDLVLDLRRNPGGYLQKATNMLNQLFPEKGDLLVYTQGRAVNRMEYKTRGRGIFDINKIALLIDEGSASASEILAGAVQDHDRGIIVGRRSFGKGLVQEQYQLKDGSALRLTIARYYTPSGRSIQKSYEDLEAYENDFSQRYESGELISEANIKIKDSTRYFTENGRVVFGGGGIIPDVFVPMDTQGISDDYMVLRQQIPNFTFRYIDQYNETLQGLSLAEFALDFKVSEQDFQNFLEFSRSAGATFDENQLNAKSQQELKQQLKARVGKHLFDELGYYKIMNQNDPMILSALDALKDYENILKRKQFKN